MAAPKSPGNVLPAELNPRTTEYDFFGPIGALAVTITVPAIVYALYFGCAEETGGCPPDFKLQDLVSYLSNEGWWKDLWDTEATIAYLGWYAFCVICWIILPGGTFKGAILRDGSVKEYKINGFATFMLAIGLAVGSNVKYRPQPMAFNYHPHVVLSTGILYSRLTA
ncbi:hypothetical protein MPER_09499 [Moniliophthora perniciosa FA553]|nr:hypothetical protein MPER_09499 [Moniliophthora perniciosa FA553]